MRNKTRTLVAGLALWLLASATAFGKETPKEGPGDFESRVAGLREAVEDLIATFADRYPDGRKFLTKLDEVDEEEFEIAV